MGRSWAWLNARGLGFADDFGAEALAAGFLLVAGLVNFFTNVVPLWRFPQFYIGSAGGDLLASPFESYADSSISVPLASCRCHRD